MRLLTGMCFWKAQQNLAVQGPKGFSDICNSNQRKQPHLSFWYARPKKYSARITSKSICASATYSTKYLKRVVIFLTSALSKKVIPPLKLLQWWAFCIALKEVRHFVAFDWRWCAKVKLGHLNRNKVTTDRLVIKIYIYIYI